MSCYSLRRMIKTLEKTGSLEAKSRSGRPSTCKSGVATVSQNVEAIETLSTYGERQEFASWVFRQIDIDENWLSNVLWTDEAQFSLNGEVNTQNSRIWATENPRIFTEMPLHQRRVIVWCGFTSSFIIGPFFFEEINGRTFKTASVTGERYVQLLREKVIPILQDRQALSEITFMQDGEPPHISRGGKQLLKDTFGEDRVISRHFIHQWPSRSPDLTPCDFWIWGYIKSRVYRCRPTTLVMLKASIRRHVSSISSDIYLMLSILSSIVCRRCLRMKGATLSKDCLPDLTPYHIKVGRMTTTKDDHNEEGRKPVQIEARQSKDGGTSTPFQRNDQSIFPQRHSRKSRKISRAPAFTSEKFRKFLITHGIQPLLTTSNNPQANGLIERLNATITGKLRLAYLENPKASWTQLVKRVTQTYNNTPHSVTSFPPTYLMFNVVPPDLRTHLNPYPEIIRAREIARSRTQNKHKKDKETFDKQHRTPHFEVNDLVLVKNYRHPDTGKLAPYFTGPYKIIEIISPNVVRIDRPNQPLNRDSDTIHINKLKYYTENVLYITPPHTRYVQKEQRISPDSARFYLRKNPQISNNTSHSVTSFPPTYLMFNVVPPDLRTHLNPYPEITRAREIARSRTQNKHKKDKETFDKQHRTPHFEVNDLVLVKNYRHPDTGKLAPYFTGPYKIIEIISPNVVRIDRPNQPLNRDSDTIHVNKLKYYTENVLYITPPHTRYVQKEQRMSPDVYLSEFKHLTSDIFETQLYRIIPPQTSQPFLHLNPDLFNSDRFKTNLK
ncbi:hypothetical protein LAZ67_3004168 [Cordylochernes scorpioides]|uniref:Integrase catalytic domain-containing protein n=1 Tax=Cordylochernes scorpioides TaxID=51811 RepID=A0ABY6KAX7_9ARAC|nr:hypothetical protein LAZ67_3004168 [Cordylochernes scorpioides]